MSPHLKHVRELKRLAGRDWTFKGYDGTTHVVFEHVSGVKVGISGTPRDPDNAVRVTLQKMRRVVR
jgi:hypothetical protein